MQKLLISAMMSIKAAEQISAVNTSATNVLLCAANQAEASTICFHKTSAKCITLPHAAVYFFNSSRLDSKQRLAPGLASTSSKCSALSHLFVRTATDPQLANERQATEFLHQHYWSVLRGRSVCAIIQQPVINYVSFLLFNLSYVLMVRFGCNLSPALD